MQVLSPKHIYPAEILHVQVLPKLSKDSVTRKLARSFHSSQFSVRRRSENGGDQHLNDDCKSVSLSRRGSLKKICQSKSSTYFSKTCGYSRQALIRVCPRKSGRCRITRHRRYSVPVQCAVVKSKRRNTISCMNLPISPLYTAITRNSEAKRCSSARELKHSRLDENGYH